MCRTSIRHDAEVTIVALASVTSSPEATLLLVSARRTMDTTACAVARAAIRDGVDWDVFLSLARHHGLIPLMQHHVTAGTISAADIPAYALTALQLEATTIARRSLYLTGELIAILRDFAAQEIPCVPLKGPALALSPYGDVALRRINDLDIFVHESDLPRAIARLADRGYTNSAMPSAEEQRTSHHVSMYASPKVRVELHYHLLHPVGRQQFHLADVAHALRPGTFQGMPVQQLSDELLLTYLSVHGAEHLWERLEWLVGVTELLRSGRVLDWTLVDMYARQFGEVRRVYTTFAIVHQLLGAPVPDAVLEAGKHVPETARFVVRRYVNRPGRLFGSGLRFWHRLRLDAAFRVRFTRSWITFHRHQSMGQPPAHHSRPLQVMYYVMRPVWLAFRYGVGRVWQRGGNA